MSPPWRPPYGCGRIDDCYHADQGRPARSTKRRGAPFGPVVTLTIAPLIPVIQATGTARRTVVDMRILRIGCSRCTNDATALSWAGKGDGQPLPTCPLHTDMTRQPLPSLTNLQLAMLWLVADRPGSSTVDLANRGSPSWTVRGTGVVLSRLARVGLVSPAPAGRHRAWYQTEVGRALSAFIQPPAPFKR